MLFEHSLNNAKIGGFLPFPLFKSVMVVKSHNPFGVEIGLQMAKYEQHRSTGAHQCIGAPPFGKFICEFAKIVHVLIA